jgi:hypothetical protein
LIASSIRSSLSFSPSSIFETGMPVHFETTSAISSSVTLLRTSVVALGLGLDAPRRASLLELRDLAVLQLGHPREVALARAPRARAALLELFLDVAAPCSAAFSLFQISSRSAYSFSRPERLLQRSRRFFVASSFSFFSASRSIFSWMMRRSSRSSSSGFESISMRMRDAASSIRSIALSGSCRSVM